LGRGRSFWKKKRGIRKFFNNFQNLINEVKKRVKFFYFKSKLKLYMSENKRIKTFFGVNDATSLAGSMIGSGIFIVTAMARDISSVAFNHLVSDCDYRRCRISYGN
jgi:hypothetical protein